MLNHLLMPGLLVSLFSFSLVLADGHAKSENAEEDGFASLYNGKDLTGWKTEGNWIPQEDGTLAIQPREGESGWKRYKSYLYTEKQYDNFIFSVEYKLPKKGNSGLHFRVADPGEDWDKIDPVAKGIECQILDSYGKPDDKMTHHDHGGIIRTQPASKKMSKPAGEWQKMVLTCKGQNIRVKLNGEEIINIQQDKTGMKGRPLKGYISLQDHGQLSWFRNIKIKELD